MTEVDCVRCGNTASGLTKSPIPGELGIKVLNQVCEVCWKEWLAAQVILINEKGLTGADPEHVEYLMQQMQTFLNLQTEAEHGEPSL